MTAIYKRELRACFNSMIGWLFVAALCVFIGIYFMANNLMGGYPYFSTSLGSCLFLFMVAIPLLTMRSMAEDRASRTDQLLLSSPVSVGGLVMGKYLAMVTVLAIPVGLACLCPLIIALNGTAYLAADYGTILAFFLLGAAEIAVGLLVSALTESQIIAAVGSFALLLLLYLWDGLVDFLPVTAAGSLIGLLAAVAVVCLLLHALSASRKLTAAVAAAGAAVLAGFYIADSSAFAGLLPDLLGRFSLLGAFDTFAVDHIFDLRTLVLYLSLTALLLFLTGQVVQRRRWN